MTVPEAAGQHIEPKALATGIAFGVAAGAFWGTVFIGPKLLTGFSPMELSVARYLAYGLISGLLIAPRRRVFSRVAEADWWALLRLSLVGNLLYYLFLAFAVQLSGVGVASLIIGLLPVSITLVGTREAGAVPLQKLAGPLLVIALGIVLINVDLFTRDLGGGDVVAKLIGVGCAVLALICWTYYAVENARWLRRAPQFSSQDWSLLTGIVTGGLALVGLPVFFLHAGTPTASWTMLWAVSAGLALGASVIGTALWNGASRLLPLTLSGQMIVFETLFALLYNFIAEQRFPRMLEALAIVSLVAGVWWSARLHPTAPEAERGA